MVFRVWVRMRGGELELELSSVRGGVVGEREESGLNDMGPKTANSG